METTDALLLRRWIDDRDAESFQELVARHSRMVYAAAYRVLRDPHRAEDVSQECFLRISRSKEREPCSLAAWMHRIATNLAIDVLRSERRRRRPLDSPRPAPDVADEAAWSEVHAFIDEAIASLPEDQRIPVVEHFLGGRTHAAIAAGLGITREAVGYRIRMGIEAILGGLKRHGISLGAAALASGLSSLSDLSAAPLSPALREALGRIAVAGPGLRGPLTAMAERWDGAVRRAAWARMFAARGPRLALLAVGSAIAIVAGISLWRPAGEPRPEPLTAQGLAVPSPPPAIAPEDRRDIGSAPHPVAGEPPAPVSGPPPRALEGRVVDGAGAPAAGATVHFAIHPGGMTGGFWSRRTCFSTTTGEDGGFRFEGIPERGLASLTAIKDGEWAPRRSLRIEKLEAGKPVTLSLQPGAVVRGVVLSPRGEPIDDGVVSLCHEWNDKVYLSGSPSAARSFRPTDEDGAFSLAVDPQATLVAVRISSDSLGEQFVSDIATPQEDLVLRLLEPAAIGGRVLWNGGRAAAGLRVSLSSTVPRPPPLARSTLLVGGLEILQRHALVDETGAYAFSLLPPGLSYEVHVVDPSTGRTLSPRRGRRVSPSAGETAPCDFTIFSPARISGRVITEARLRPVPGLQVAVIKDGKHLSSATTSRESGEDGGYEVELTNGPGAYLLAAVIEASWREWSEFVAARYGKRFEIQGGEDLEADLVVCEPTLLPIRVSDSSGNPAGSVRAAIRMPLPGGKGIGFEKPYSLGSEGASVLEIYCPVDRFSIVFSAAPDGPPVEMGDLAAAPGIRLPEVPIHLPPTCDLRGTALSPDGTPWGEETIRIRATFQDAGLTAHEAIESFSCRTDGAGRFVVKHRLRASPVTLEITVGGKGSLWRSPLLSPVVGGILDLGEVRLTKP